jgi:hypothetical protein
VRKSCDRAALKPGRVLAGRTDDLVCWSPVPTTIMHCNLQGHTWNKSKYCFSVLVKLRKTKIISNTDDHHTESFIFKCMWSWARIAQWYSTRLQVGWSGLQVLAGAGNFSLCHCVQTGSGAHTASYPMDTRGSFPGGVKQLRCELTTHLHLVPRSRMHGAIPSLPHAFMVWCLVQHRDNFNMCDYTDISNRVGDLVSPPSSICSPPSYMTY